MQYVRFLYAFVFWFAKHWYTITQKVTGNRATARIPQYESENAYLWMTARGSLYESDKWRGVLETMTHPGRTMYLVNQFRAGEDVKLGDCDDHAAFRAALLLSAPDTVNVALGMLRYQKPDNLLPSKHMVVLITRKPTRAHEKTTHWADYNEETQYSGPWGWAESVAARTSGRVLGAGTIQIEGRTDKGRLLFGATHTRIW